MGSTVETVGNDTENPDETKHLSSNADVHALLLPFKDQGHINPLMLLGKRLAARGVQVTLALPKHVRARISSSQPDIWQQQSHDSVQLEDYKDGVVPGAPIGPPQHGAEERAFEEGALQLVQKLASQGRPVTCIVSDLFWRWTRSLAARAKLPEFVFWSQSATVLSIYFNLDSILSAGYNPFKDNVKASEPGEASRCLQLEANCFPGLPLSIRFADLPFEFGFADGLVWLREWLMDRFGGLGESEGVICNTFDALEADAVNGLNFQFSKASPHALYGQCWPRMAALRQVGPLVPNVIFEGDPHPSVQQEEGTDCLQWLDAQPADSVLYVAFGTLRPLSSTQIHELAWGLAAGGRKVLWVLRRDATKPIQERYNEEHLGRPPPGPTQMKSLDEMLPPGFLERNRDMCKIVRWAPQALVLSHAAVGGFFSHCGWNSTLESVCSGVPILGWPAMMDQFTNCWLVTNLWKVGLSLERDKDNNTSREMVEKGVRQLMEGPQAVSMRARARELAVEARKAYAEDGAASELIVPDLLKASSAAA